MNWDDFEPEVKELVESWLEAINNEETVIEEVTFLCPKQ